MKQETLTIEIDALATEHEYLIDLSRLLLECVHKIAFGKSECPQTDAINTLRGAAIIASEALQ